MNRFPKVYLRENPSQTGRVYMRRGSKAFVVWEGEEDGGTYSLSELGASESSSSLIHAPEIADLEYTTRLDPETDTVYMERNNSYQGRSAPLPVVESADNIYEAFRYMGELDREHIVVGLLNVRNELMGWKVVHATDLASVEASGRAIVRDAFLANAAGIFIIHNHPTGDPTPSEEDKKVTEYIADLTEPLDLNFFDHVIIGCEADHHAPYYSFREDNQLS